VIASLSDLAGLLVEFQPDTSFMSMTGTDVGSWFNAAGSDYVTLNYYGDGDGAPVWTPDALGTGRNALYFRNGKMRADVSWTCSDLTAVFVGSLDYGNATASYPRWLSVARYGVFEEDYSSPDTWVVAGYESSLHALIADRNYTRAILAPLDVSRNYIIATRKRAGTKRTRTKVRRSRPRVVFSKSATTCVSTLIGWARPLLLESVKSMQPIVG